MVLTTLDIGEFVFLVTDVLVSIKEECKRHLCKWNKGRNGYWEFLLYYFCVGCAVCVANVCGAGSWGCTAVPQQEQRRQRTPSEMGPGGITAQSQLWVWADQMVLPNQTRPSSQAKADRAFPQVHSDECLRYTQVRSCFARYNYFAGG